MVGYTSDRVFFSCAEKFVDGEVIIVVGPVDTSKGVNGGMLI